jgi:hypothetical protein
MKQRALNLFKKALEVSNHYLKLKVEPQNTESRFSLAYVLASLGKVKESLHILSQQPVLTSSNATALHAICLLQQEKVIEAYKCVCTS